MQALIDAGIPVRAVISNRPDAAGLGIAAGRGIATRVVDHRAHASREAFEAALAADIERYEPRLVALAGFMRVLTSAFVARYAGRLLNIHPSLLPAFPGLHTHERALQAGVKVHGCTVHFVTADLDHGPIVAQAAVRGLSCPSDARIARAYGTHSARRARRLLGYFEEQGLVVVHSDLAGHRIVAFPDLNCETLPGDANGPDLADSHRDAAE